MKGLIMNDLFSLRKLLRSVAMVFVFFMVLWGAMGQPASGALMIGVMSVSYMLNLFSYDEFYHWDQYTAILPVSSRQLVLARYASFALTSLVATTVAAVYMLVMQVPLDEFVMVVIASLCMQTYTAAIIIPFAYKFGVQKGRIFYMLLMFVPLGIFLGGLGIAFEGGGAQAVNQIAFLIFGALLVLFLLGVLVSIRISIRIVSRKQY